MRRVMKIASITLASTLALAACGSAPEGDGGAAGGGSASGGAAKDYKACMVSDEGGWDDKSFNETSHKGLESAASSLGIATKDVESSSNADFSSNVDSLVQQNCNMIVGTGFKLASVMQASAKANTDIDYALVDSAFTDAKGNVVKLENAKPLLFNTAEASFLAGYLAAGMSKTGKVATFGGLQIPSVSVFMDGFADGVKKYNEDNKKDVELLGWNKGTQKGSFAGGFTDQTQGQTLTKQFLAQGADIVMPVAGPVGLGAAQAIESKKGARMIWVDTDGYESTDYGKIILTSVIKKMDVAVETAITDGANGTFDAKPYVGTLENEGVGIAPYHDFDAEVPAELKKAVDDLKQQIIDGKITVESKNSPKS